MDISALAQQAVSVVAAHLSAVGAGVVDAAEDGAVRTVYGLLQERLSRTALGKTVLDQLQQQPQDPGRQQVAAAAVAEQAQADPAFAEALRSVIDQGFTGQAVRHSPVNLSAARDLRLDRSYVSAGDMDNSRKSVRIGLGGWVLAAVLLAAGATTTGVVIGSSDDPPEQLDPMSIGTDIGEAGVRQAAEAVRDAYADRDTGRLCALSTEETQGELGPGTERSTPPSECPRILADALNALPETFVAESRTLSVEKAHVSDDETDNRGFARLVNRDPGAFCQHWKLTFIRENGRWRLSLDYFHASYLDIEPGKFQTHVPGCLED